MTMLYGIAAVAVLWGIVNLLAQANAVALAKAIRIASAILAFGAAVLLGLRGRIDMALGLGGLGAWLLGWSSPRIRGLGESRQRTSGNISRVRSIMVEMQLDHDTGEMHGSVLSGAFTGRRLASLDEESLQQLLTECRAADPDGVRLIEAYLDRRFPHWRESSQEHEEQRTGTRPASGSMSEEEAYQVLGLRQGASADEIRKAHRTLMKKLHPDQGGSTYLAARVNQAKEILLGRHH